MGEVRAILITASGALKEVSFPSKEVLEALAHAMGLEVDETSEGDIVLEEPPLDEEDLYEDEDAWEEEA